LKVSTSAIYRLFSNAAFEEIMMPTMMPNNPRAEPKISMMSIFTNILASCASEMAQELPTTPTQIPQKRLARPTVMPAAKSEYAAYMIFGSHSFPAPYIDVIRLDVVPVVLVSSQDCDVALGSSLVAEMIAIMTP